MRLKNQGHHRGFNCAVDSGDKNAGVRDHGFLAACGNGIHAQGSVVPNNNNFTHQGNLNLKN